MMQGLCWCKPWFFVYLKDGKGSAPCEKKKKKQEIRTENKLTRPLSLAVLGIPRVWERWGSMLLSGFSIDIVFSSAKRLQDELDEVCRQSRLTRLTSLTRNLRRKEIVSHTINLVFPDLLFLCLAKVQGRTACWL